MGDSAGVGPRRSLPSLISLEGLVGWPAVGRATVDLGPLVAVGEEDARLAVELVEPERERCTRGLGAQQARRPGGQLRRKQTNTNVVQSTCRGVLAGEQAHFAAGLLGEVDGDRVDTVLVNRHLAVGAPHIAQPGLLALGAGLRAGWEAIHTLDVRELRALAARGVELRAHHLHA